MNRVLTSTLAALLALPLIADEPKKTETAKPPQAATAAQPAPEDSPLVAASKRANRLGRKPKSKIVITNETLKQSGAGAHVTTSEVQPGINIPPPPPPPRPTPEMVAAKRTAEQQKVAAQVAAAKEQKEAEQRAKQNAAWEAVEEEYPDDVDPAQAEKALRDAYEAQKAEKPPES
jgi:hypothetical protein